MRVFANVLGYWTDRVHWLEWLINAAERRDEFFAEDRAFVVDTMSALGWTLTTLRQLDAASRHLNRAWALREFVAPIDRATIARHLAWLAMYRKQYGEAQQWIDEHTGLLADPSIPARERVREEIEALSYRGIICDEQGDYAQADALFREMLATAEARGWERGWLDACLWRADVARKTRDYDTARRLLDAVLPRAQRLGDRRVIAFYKRALAHLELTCEHPDEAYRLATEAMDELRRLGLQSEMEELRELLDACRGVVAGSGLASARRSR